MAVEFNTFYKEFCNDVREGQNLIENSQALDGWVRLEVDCGFTNSSIDETNEDYNKYVHEYLGGTGFGAAAYGKDTNGDGTYDAITIAYRGMEPSSPEDLVAALTLYYNNEATKGGQFADALTFYNAVATQYGEPGRVGFSPRGISKKD